MSDPLDISTKVCSAHAEMIPARPSAPCFSSRLLRTRGDDPDCLAYRDKYAPSAPHTRR